jgi:RNA polymerase sigma-70 factor (ECF subfamily)
MATPQPDPKAVPGTGAAGDAASGPISAAPAPESPVSVRVNRGPAPSSNTRETRAREAEEDRALIAKAQAGDTTAFRSLVERHQRRAFAIAYSLVRDENDAREVVQDAFLRVFKGLGTFQGGSSFFTWLYRIITNLSIDLLRKPGRGPAGGLAELEEGRLEGDHDSDSSDYPLLSRIDGSDPADVVRRREIGVRLQSALDALPPYHRGVIVMREIEGLSYEEMAHAMSVSKGTIMSRLFHARQKLQRALCDCYEEQVGKQPPTVEARDASAKAESESEDGAPPTSGGSA